MNQIVSKLFLARDTFMTEMHLSQPAALRKRRFNYSACGQFTKTKERIQKFKETRDARYIY